MITITLWKVLFYDFKTCIPGIFDFKGEFSEEYLIRPVYRKGEEIMINFE